MRQKRVYTVDDAIGSANGAIRGANDHGVILGLQRNTAPVITNDKNTLAARHAEAIAAKVELAARQAALRSWVVTVIAFAIKARNAFTGTLGRQHSAAWMGAGFVSSLIVPR